MPNPDNIKGQGFHTDPDRINKAGRPPGRSITSILKDLLEGTIKNASGEVKTRAEVLALTLLEKGIKGKDLRAIEQILDRTEGKPLQKVEQKTDGVTEIRIIRNGVDHKPEDTPPQSKEGTSESETV